NDTPDPTTSRPNSPLQRIIDQYLATIADDLENFLRNRIGLTLWTPENEVPYSDFLVELEIPMLCGGPDMLLHRLGSFADDAFYQKRMLEIFSKDDHRPTVLLNTSGSGKTRLTFEALCQFWGLYIVCAVDSQNRGSEDLKKAMQAVMDDALFTLHLPRYSPAELTNAHKRNRIITNLRFKEVIYARLLIMEAFCEIALKVGSGCFHEKHKESWLLLQVKRNLLPGTTDIFLELWERIRGRASNSELNTVIKNTKERLTELLRCGQSKDFRAPPFFCVIDEAQSAATMCLGAFVSRGTASVRRPILRDIVTVFVGAPGMQLVVTGTGMDTAILRQVMASAVHKDNAYRKQHYTGGFSRDSQATYMMSLMPPSFKNSDEGQELIMLAWQWISGRFRFTSNFMRQLLEAGFTDSHRLLQDFVRTRTERPGFTITGGSLDDAETDIKRNVEVLSDFDFVRLRNNPKLFKDVKSLLAASYMRSDGIILEEGQKGLVELGFGRIANKIDNTVTLNQRVTRYVLDEPLVQLALERWLAEEDVPLHEIYEESALQGSNDANGANPLEQYFAFYLSTVFNGKTPLTSIFVFPPNDIPEWANKPAKLVSLYRKEFPHDEIESGTVGYIARPSVTLGISGEGSNVKTWLTHRHRAPFLFPDGHMGPDIMCVLELGDEARSRIWVAVQSKYCGTSPFLPVTTLEKALRSVTPSQFYMPRGNGESAPGTKEWSRDKTLELLAGLPRRLETGAGKYSVLRVVASPVTIDMYGEDARFREEGLKAWLSERNAETARKNALAAAYAARNRASVASLGQPLPLKKIKIGLEFFHDPDHHPAVALNLEFMEAHMRQLQKDHSGAGTVISCFSAANFKSKDLPVKRSSESPPCGEAEERARKRLATGDVDIDMTEENIMDLDEAQ
ncbi:hypothetical protein R3P38DRAFT_2539190, partial [Favolaschia claudopus]